MILIVFYFPLEHEKYEDEKLFPFLFGSVMESWSREKTKKRKLKHSFDGKTFLPSVSLFSWKHWVIEQDTKWSRKEENTRMFFPSSWAEDPSDDATTTKLYNDKSPGRRRGEAKKICNLFKMKSLREMKIILSFKLSERYTIFIQ